MGGAGLIHVEAAGRMHAASSSMRVKMRICEKDGAAIAMVTRMDALFLVDRHARQQQLGTNDRAALRLEHARPWVEEIHSKCVKLRSLLLPKSALGEGGELHLKYVA